MEINNRIAIFEETKQYCPFAKDEDFIEITEWTNGEGVDINVNDSLGNRILPVTWGEFDLIKKLIKKLNQ